MYFLKGSLIIFLLHFVFMGAFCALMASAYDLVEPNMPNEAPELWIIFYVIYSPVVCPLAAVIKLLSFVFPFLVTCLESPLLNPFPSPFLDPRLNYYWDWVIFPGLFFQVAGWISWSVVYGVLLVTWRTSKRLF